jgi:hypothetical protein
MECVLMGPFSDGSEKEKMCALTRAVFCPNIELYVQSAGWSNSSMEMTVDCRSYPTRGEWHPPSTEQP